jgi:AraC-like DNA-binding protein
MLGRQLFGKDLVQRVGQALAWGRTIKRRILGTVRYPDIRDRAGAEFFAEPGADAARGGTVLDPELTNLFIRMRERAFGRERVREIGGVEIEAVQAVRVGPVHPRGEVLWLDGIPVHGFAGEVGVDRVEIESVATGQKLENQFEIGAQLVKRAGLARVVARGLNTATGEGGIGFFKASDVIALPAVHGNRGGGQGGERGLNVHAQGGVGFTGGGEGGRTRRTGCFGQGSHGLGYVEKNIAGLRPELNVCFDLAIQILNTPHVTPEFSRYLGITTEAEAWGVVVRAGGRIVNEPGSAYPPAGHPADHNFAWQHGRVLGAWQVVLITQGEGEFENKPGTPAPQPVKAGDVIWVAPERWHRYRPTPAGWTERWVELGGPVMAKLTEAEILPGECSVLHPSQAEALEEVMAALHLVLYQRAGADRPAELAALGLRMLTLLTARRPQEGSRLERAVQRAKHILGEGRTESLSMPALARELGVNYGGFRREFRRLTGLAPKQYLMRLRLEHAQRLIGATPYTLEAVAEKLGFSSAFHLSAAFKKHYGISPSTWRLGGQSVEAAERER